MSRIHMLAGILAAGMLLAPVAGAQQSKAAKSSRQATKSRAQSDMQRAIQFQRNEDLAAARQARLEARHPTVFYNTNEADRLKEEDTVRHGRSVPDPGSKQWQRDKHN